MLPTLPRQVRRASVPLVLRGYATCFKPSPVPAGRGPFFCYSRDEARSIRQRSVSSARSRMRLIQLTSLTRKAGFCIVPNAWEESHATHILYFFRCRNQRCRIAMAWPLCPTNAMRLHPLEHF